MQILEQNEKTEGSENIWNKGKNTESKTEPVDR